MLIVTSIPQFLVKAYWCIKTIPKSKKLFQIQISLKVSHLSINLIPMITPQMHHLPDSQSWSDAMLARNLHWLKLNTSMEQPQNFGAYCYFHFYAQVHVVFALIHVKTWNMYVETVIKALVKIRQSFVDFWFFIYFSPSIISLNF